MHLSEVFATADDLLSVRPEDLAGVIMEIRDPRNELFTMTGFIEDCMERPGRSGGFPGRYRRRVIIAVAEALSWLQSHGLIMLDPEQPGEWYLVTRRGAALRSRHGVDAFRKAAILPRDLLDSLLIERSWPLFARGDYETAVFQAFKEVEVAVRSAAGYGEDQYGTSLVRKAFHAETGPLSDQNAVPSERQALSDLFAGAIGFAKNPTSHRRVIHRPQEAAQLIIFASYLLGLVEQRRQDIGAAPT